MPEKTNYLQSLLFCGGTIFFNKGKLEMDLRPTVFFSSTTTFIYIGKKALLSWSGESKHSSCGKNEGVEVKSNVSV